MSLFFSAAKISLLHFRSLRETVLQTAKDVSSNVFIRRLTRSGNLNTALCDSLYN